MSTCEHCPDGHTPADGGSQPWSAWVTEVRDGDGQPTHIMVARTAGAHVAESDAEWIRTRLNATPGEVKDTVAREIASDLCAFGFGEAASFLLTMLNGKDVDPW